MSPSLARVTLVPPVIVTAVSFRTPACTRSERRDCALNPRDGAPVGGQLGGQVAP